ncbi:MAG TPA: STAS domain-containing protein [Gaiellaceae bacterium]|jgi:anti-anti-sigma factor|nr:STAS domain-containing protein [Gaiellaceae bacterium]
MDLLDFRLTTAELVDGTYVVTVSGEADAADVESLSDELEEVLGEGASCVIVDLLEVPFIDSAVLGVLLRVSRRLRSGGGELVLVADDPRVLRTFEIAGLSAQFRFARTLTTAVEDVIQKSVS